MAKRLGAEEAKWMLAGVAREKEQLQHRILELDRHAKKLQRQYRIGEGTESASLPIPMTSRKRIVNAETRQKLSERMKARWATRKSAPAPTEATATDKPKRGRPKKR